MQKRVAVNVVENAPPPLGAYSHAVFAGPLLFIAGQGSRDAVTGQEAGLTLDGDGNVLAYDIAAQTRGVLDNLTSVLKAAGLGLKDVVDVSVFLKEMKDFAAYNKVYGEYFAFPEPPSRTTVAVKDLPGRNFIEIKAIAYRSPQGKE